MSNSTDRTLATKAASHLASRRTFLAGSAVAGLTLAGVPLLESPLVSAAGDPMKIKRIFTIARTAEQLAVTFYSNGLANADALGLGPEAQGQIQAALVEEQIHQQFFTAQGGDSLTDTFSFPQGAKTFTDLQTFIATQQMLEGVFDSAFLAAIREFAEMGEARLAQIAGQIACIESEHRALGRDIAGLDPGDNWTYAPVLVAFVEDAPAAVTAAGFLSPVPGNTYKYAPVDTSLAGIMYKDGPFSQRP